MARRFIFQCDGCDSRLEQDKGSLPIGFAEVCVELSGLNLPYHGLQTTGKTYLLCSACQSSLADRCDPSTWPRASSTMDAVRAEIFYGPGKRLGSEG